MNQLILKNLWARRSRNLWLLAEIVLVCIVSWKIADPLVVLTHDRTLPEGFRSDHLFVLELATLPEKSGKFRPEEDDSLSRRENLGRIFQQVKNYEGVESATFFFNRIMPYSGSSTTSPQTFKGDSTYMSAWQISFLNRSDFFRTMGFEGAEGMTAGELDERIFDKDEYVLTANTSEFFLHPESPLTGRTTWNNDSTAEYRVAGVIKPFRYRSYMQPQPVRLNPLSVMPERYYSDLPQIVFRIGDRLSEEVFLHHFIPWTGKELKAGNIYVNSVQSYTDLRKQSEFSAGTTDTYRKNITLGLFFLINLCLGVAGTFWLQTRTRREEVGIMLSFGARPQNIVRMLLGEGWVLTTIGTLLGCLVYLQYALKEGLYSTNWGSWSPEVASPAYWINHFGWHFLATSLMVYTLLQIVVSVGIWIPARKISRINPVDALRDE